MLSSDVVKSSNPTVALLSSDDDKLRTKDASRISSKTHETFDVIWELSLDVAFVEMFNIEVMLEVRLFVRFLTRREISAAVDTETRIGFAAGLVLSLEGPGRRVKLTKEIRK